MMLAGTWKLCKRIVLAAVVLLFFFVVLEAIRAYQTLRELHPLAGYAFLGLLAAGFIYLAWHYLRYVAARPAVLRPVRLADSRRASGPELQRYLRYLIRYLSALGANELLTPDDRDRLDRGIADLEALGQGRRGPEELAAAVGAVEDDVLLAVLARLDEQAAREVRLCTRDVMVAVALSPYRAADLFIVLYRNLAMVIRIVRVYNRRPRLADQLRILADTLRVVATVNFIHMGKSLIEGLGTKVPFIRSYTDELVQSIGAGFMTSVAGHAAMDRCRAFRGWNEQEAKNRIRDRVAEFYADVRDICKKDILSIWIKRAGDLSKETVEKIGSVLDEMGSRIGTFVKKPFQTATADPKAASPSPHSSPRRRWFGRGRK
ncbi:MAG: YcjF family protein [Sedimentisphaerales bacterium]|nr:YcjF family protein [Sedimentisphaerales bacterium]